MNQRILIVDDDKDLCLLLKRNLEAERYHVNTCHDDHTYDITITKPMAIFLYSSYEKARKGMAICSTKNTTR